MNDEDVFDSITWESPANQPQPEPSAGPGFRQSTSDENPDEPKWEGYLIVSVRDPVKEHADTKDAYVSYLVMAKVCASQCQYSRLPHSQLDKSSHIFYTQPYRQKALPRLCLSSRTSFQRLPGMRRPSLA